MECCLNAKLTISNDVGAKLVMDDDVKGTVVIQDGTNDYRKLIILKSPNGTRWKIGVDDSGNLTTAAG